MKLFKTVLVTSALLLGVNQSTMANEADNFTVFTKSDKVKVSKVHFKNRFGITLCGNLYEPIDIQDNAILPSIAISGPFGAVKEQASGLYAQTLALRGFVTLAFDPSYTGESSGEPRNIASPDINTEDFSAAVDFLTNYKHSDANKVGILGICGFGGFALNDAAIDTRVKATVTSTMYDMTRVSAKGYNDTVDASAHLKFKEALNEQRTKDFKNGTFAKAQGLPEKLTGKEPQFIQDYYNYYKTKRGFHPRSINSNGNWNMTSSLSLINLPILAYSNEIESAVLMIHGENAHSRYFSENAFKKLQGNNKELLIVKGANHTDLYDNMDKIPFDKIEKFYKDNLK